MVGSGIAIDQAARPGLSRLNRGSHDLRFLGACLAPSRGADEAARTQQYAEFLSDLRVALDCAKAPVEHS